MVVDLTDFREEHEAALDAASEFRRRAERGLPPDRWADGTAGQRKVAHGIAIMEWIMEAQADAILALMDEKRQSGYDAMAMHGKRPDAP